MSAPGLDRDRWQRIKQLVADAATRPPAERARFLDDACPDDAAMRQEVEALLAAHDQAGDFFERRPPAASAFAGAGFAAAPLHLAPGRLLGPYEIVDAIGAGGMGEVYRARDTRLHRDVALKVLPLALVADPSRRARFVQEARAASALEHPHIAVIHDIGEVEGVTFIAMELVRGEPLSDVVARGPLAPARALDVAIEIAEGLARAHEIGVVHRDLKPANVMLAEERHAKIIDFGLAKLVDALGGDGAVTGAWNVTESGMALGTASYMSPEQARGAKVDHRTDIFSFGILLYELLTGHSPFRGTSRVDTLHAILYDPAPPLPPSIGPATDDLQRILEKCLAKEPEDRYQGMRDLVVDLRAARRRLDSSQIRAAAGAPAGSTTVGRARLRRGALLAAALMLVGVIAGRAWWIARTETPGTAAEAPLLHLTSDGGLTTDPALSPDGKLVVYASDRAGGDNLDLWVQQIGGGAPFRLTFDPADEYEPSFSPDGARIVFRSERDGGGVYVMPALGGEPRLIAKAGRQPRFSPDGTRIAYITGTGSGQSGISSGELFAVPSTGGAARKLVSENVGAENVGVASPVWSPDGAFILLAKGKYRIEDWAIARSDRADSLKVLPLETLQKAGLADLAPREWLEGNRILFEAKYGDSSQIFEIRLRPPSWITNTWRLDGAPRRLTAGTGQDERPALASLGSATGGRRLAFASLSRKENLWSVLLDTSQPRTEGKLTQLTQGGGFHIFPSVSMDGTKAAFISHAAYNDEVSLLDVRTGKRSLLSTTMSRKFKAHIRPEGSEVFYGDTGSIVPHSPGTQAVYTVSVSGGPPERLCEKCGSYVWDRSPDRRYLLIHATGHPWAPAMLVDLETKNTRTFLQRPGADLSNFDWSPNGRWLVFQARAAGRSRIYVAPFSGDQAPAESAWIPITNGSTLEDKTHWSPDGGWIYATSNRDGFLCVWAYPVDPQTMQPAGEPVAVFHAHGARISLRNANLDSQDLSVARDKVVFNQGEITGNIWMTELNDRD